jgi:hypothetical protein
VLIFGGGGSEEELPWKEDDGMAEEVEDILFFNRGDVAGGGGKLDMLQRFCFFSTQCRDVYSLQAKFDNSASSRA